jgi:uncharacterized protein YbaP (TraB family)
MIQRRARVLVPLLALAAVAVAPAACKKSDPAPAAGSGTAAAGSGTGIVVDLGSGAAQAITGSGSDVGSATPKPGDAITRPFFYKVEKDGKTSYLLGTWHVGVDAQKQLPKAVWDALGAATTFAMEVDPADPAGLTGHLRTDGKTLEQDLGAEYWAKLEAAFGPGASMVQKMTPGAAAMVLQFKDLPQTVPMEVSLIGKAKDDKKQLVFLEAVKLQIALMNKWIDVRMLKQLLDDPKGSKATLDEALTAYLAGDDAVLQRMVIDRDQMKQAGFSDADVDAFSNEFLYDRNAAWIPAIEEMFGKGNAFVAVGAGHLIGPKSVVELLTAKGYTITRVGA